MPKLSPGTVADPLPESEAPPVWRSLRSSSDPLTDAVAADVIAHLKRVMPSLGGGAFDRATHRAWLEAMHRKYPSMQWNHEVIAWDLYCQRVDAARANADLPPRRPRLAPALPAWVTAETEDADAVPF